METDRLNYKISVNHRSENCIGNFTKVALIESDDSLNWKGID